MKHIFSLLFLILLTFTSIKGQSVVDTIIFKGLKKNKLSYVQKFLKTKKGSPLDTNQIIKEMYFYRNLPSFAHAWCQFDEKDGKATVTYGFDEAFTLIPDINFWISNQQLFYRLGAKEFNLFGQGVILEMAYQNSSRSSFLSGIRIPYLWKKWGVAGSFVTWNSEEPVYWKNNQLQYLYQNNTAEIDVFYDYDFYNHFEIGTNFFTEKYTYLEDEIIEIPTNLDTKKYSLKFGYRYSKLKTHFFNIAGWTNDFQFQYVNLTNGAEPFFIYRNDLMYYKRLKKKGNLAFRFRTGISTNNNSPFAPFVIDNHMGVRGVGNRVNRGTAILTMNMEYRHNFFENDWGAIQGVIFTDFSTCRIPGESFHTLLEKKQFFLHSGLGTRLILKKIYNAVLRIDYGFGVAFKDNHGFVIGLGQYF